MYASNGELKAVSVQHAQSVRDKYNCHQTDNETSVGITRQILGRIFHDYHGSLTLRLWDGSALSFGTDPTLATLVINDARVVRDLVLFQDPLRLAEAYFQGLVDIEGNLYSILGLKDYFEASHLSSGNKVALLALGSQLAYKLKHGGDGRDGRVPAIGTGRSSLTRGHSRAADRSAIAFHYDVSNDFYKLWLDQQMLYSCAYFEHPNTTLEEAQEAKLNHICRKLRLKPGDTLLDIGCGWGALIRWAALHFGVRAHGITLSRNQYEHSLDEIKRQGLSACVKVELVDYRDLEGQARFDKIVSVGMFEHVGLKNLALYFNTVRRLIKPGGLFLNHGIAHDQSGWHNTLSTRFINSYVFPDGELDRVSNVQQRMEDAGFEILDVEGLRAHYALTLREWERRLEARKAQALQIVGEEVYRVWRLYMAASALAFEEGGTGVYQILMAPRSLGPVQIPLTRRDLYV